MARLTLALSALAAALLSALAIGAGASDTASRERTDCGTYRSTSIYEKARVFAIRRVDCDVAIRVAKKFDRRSVEISPWACGLSRGAGRALFSCGYPEQPGDIREFDHALVAKAVGK